MCERYTFSYDSKMVRQIVLHLQIQAVLMKHFANGMRPGQFSRTTVELENFSDRLSGLAGEIEEYLDKPIHMHPALQA